MIVEVMVFWLVVSTALGLSALLAEDGVRAVALPTRWLWVAALWAPAALLVGGFLMPEGGPAAGAAPAWAVAVFELPGLEVGPEAGGPWVALSGVLTGLWVVSTTAMLLVVAWSVIRLRRRRVGWDQVDVLGAPVFVSEDLGPAVAGVVRPWIVLPAWALDLPAEELELVLFHEKQHLAGHDTRLLAIALGAVAMAPWNPVSWLLLRRMRTAMEVDCDRRVLRRKPDIRPYGSSLLRVAAQRSGLSLGLAAFAERPSTIKRRILAMTHAPTRWTRVRATLSAALALVVLLIGCTVDSPVTVDDREAQTVDPEASVVTDIRAEPTFTPFTVAPSILNRDEVVAAMIAEYPPLLRDAGIGGTVRVWFLIGADGRVDQVRIDESSGHPAIDQAAMNVSGAYEFSAALNGDEKVPVWVSFPITFRPDNDPGDGSND